jgi:hypothetical protein
LSSVGLAAGASVAAFLGTGRQCLAGPFDMLDPVVYRFWYLGIAEGLPIWRQDADTAIIIVLPALIGIAGYMAALHRERDRARRAAWISLLMLAAGASVLAMLVMRTGFILYLLAMPGATWLAVLSFRRARALRTATLRIPATISSVMLLFPIVAIPVKSAALPGEAPRKTHATTLNAVGVDEIAALEQLAPSTLFAPLDISPGIMLRTRNAIIGTSHHRNTRGMELVIKAFLAAPEDARAIVMRSSATYLVLAPLAETDRYREFAPRGLAAQLLDGKCPGWLMPVQLSGLKTLRLYRIVRSGPALSSVAAASGTISGPLY